MQAGVLYIVVFFVTAVCTAPLLQPFCETILKTWSPLAAHIQVVLIGSAVSGLLLTIRRPNLSRLSVAGMVGVAVAAGCVYGLIAYWTYALWDITSFYYSNACVLWGNCLLLPVLITETLRRILGRAPLSAGALRRRQGWRTAGHVLLGVGAVISLLLALGVGYCWLLSEFRTCMVIDSADGLSNAFAAKGVLYVKDRSDPFVSKYAVRSSQDGHLFGLGVVKSTYDFGEYEYTWCIPFWAIEILTPVVPGTWLLVAAKRRHHRRRIERGLCPECGYDLRESAERCPECGHALPVKGRLMHD